MTSAPISKPKSSSLRVAAIQMVSGPDVEKNLADARELMQQAADAGAELVLLPEYFCLISERDSDKLKIQESAGAGPIQDFLAACARDLNLWLVGGTVPLRASTADKVRNACLVWSPSGEVVARYDKIHLFCFHKGREAYNEGKVLEAGTSLSYFELLARSGQRWKLGLSVCYDLRFPELYQRLGCDLLLVPAAFTHTTGQAHWEVLLRARAIENQAFVLAAAQGGVHPNGRATWGQSMAIDPWGNILAQRATDPSVVLADLDWGFLQQVRTQLPSLRHRMPLAEKED